MNNKREILWRVYLVYLGILVFALMIIGKVIQIQFSEGPQLLRDSRENELRYFTREAVRGNICADNGNLIATSVPIFDIRMDVDSDLISEKLFYDKLDSLAQAFSVLFNDRSSYQYKQALIRARKAHNRYYLIKRNVTYNQLKQIKQFPILRRGKYRGGLIIIPKTKREMPFRELARRTIGYANEKEDLFVGLEGAYHEVLRGTDGVRLMRRVNNGDWIPVHDENEIEPENGKDIITTLDIDIQDVAEHALLKHLIQHEAYQGCAMLMEVKSGRVKAIANLKYDSATGQYGEYYNYAIAECVEPGSTFKLASMLIMLEDDKIKLTDTVSTGDGWTMYYNRTMQDVHKIGDGLITAREAFEQSSNVGISRLIYRSYKDKPEKFVNKLYEMGLSKALGIDIPGEGEPYIKHPDQREIWYGTTLPWMSIGYEISMTPLQILTFYNAIANGGQMVKPMFVEEVREAGGIVEEFEPEVLNNAVCSKKTIKTLRSLLEGVVERGTGQGLKNTIYKIAGKTGTAQIANRNLGYDKDNYTSSFVGYFPADHPKYSCIVVISRPTKGYYYGSSVAAPVFKEIADKVYATQLDIPMEKEIQEHDSQYPYYVLARASDISTVIRECKINADTSQLASEWGVVMPGEDKARLMSRFINNNEVPNLKGMNAEDAIYILEKLGMQTKISGRGIVQSQSIAPGSRPQQGRMIKLNLGII
ncbi:MAG: transpeptidase family protein [Bacteroidales bacterium]|nr:transpeptidase family protein [Bacteroidales bacterium]MCF8344781.1 transpeptidase family protein [Bacteroidales bacterium]MCF8352703.1 transpeptidase family protein [Bacteroidales bacterium]MCF8377432.1 transpeptidase family protein [Bacteroidales bacterium]MCF8401644.1 transpeptidase family protein [Bacteroidales bacterium]